MTDTLYWAVKLSGDSVTKLLSAVNPKHEKVFAEHVTLVFSPNEQQDAELMEIIGETVLLIAKEHVYDNKGQAVSVDGIKRHDGGVAHVTISCSSDTKPVYSNKLFANPNAVSEETNVPLVGVVARYTKNHQWDMNRKKKNDIEV